ncbi:MAG: bifunctional phosphopantothenoylcysteine decarboxylase/phosphopantothenate synthase, partial [Geminicoccaceae bacterium]|nr:bifunctional phosphopantothenoylcysteine decarboxylase/phosphopantothenate synthase [Geminicoccaceae bacterium]
MKPPVKIALIISGGIAAYKIPELIRRGRERGMDFTCIMTEAASRFVAPLALAAVSGNRVLDDLFSLTDEVEMGHIRLSRESDLVVVAPATADIIARMATGQANDLATAVLLATNRPVLIAPAMNPAMWEHPATQRNVKRLRQDGVAFVGPASG